MIYIEFYDPVSVENIATCLINGLEATNFLMTPDRDMMSMIYFLADGTYIEETARNGILSAAAREWSAIKEGTYPA